MIETQLYHYTECGLDNVFLVNGFQFVEERGGRGVIIEDMDGLHDAIGAFLANEKKPLTGKEFRFLRHEINITQSDLAKLLAVDEQTVARWEKGKTKNFGPAEKLIRVLYQERRGGNKKVREALEVLAEIDEFVNEEFHFEDTADGWQRAA